MTPERVIKLVRMFLPKGPKGFHQLARMIDMADPFTYGHSERVSRYVVALGRSLELDDGRLELLRNAALVHNLGKTVLSERIARGPGDLNEQELQEYRNHPLYAESFLLRLPQLEELAKVVRHHQERVDGRGFPDGLLGPDIPEESRIIAVADAYDVLVTATTDRPALSLDDALSQLRRGVGSAFDQLYVASFVQLIGDRHMMRAARLGASTLFAELSLRDHEKAVAYFVKKEPLAARAGIADLLRLEYPELGPEQARKIVAACVDPDSVEEDLYSDDVHWVKEDEAVVQHPARIDADVGSVVFFEGNLYSVIDIRVRDDRRFEYHLKR